MVSKRYGLSFMDFRLSTAQLCFSFSIYQPNKRIQSFLIFFRVLFSAWPLTECMQQPLPTLPPASHRARTHQLCLASHGHFWNLSQVPVTRELVTVLFSVTAQTPSIPVVLQGLQSCLTVMSLWDSWVVSAAHLHPGSHTTGSQDFGGREGVSCFKQHWLGKPNTCKGKEYKKQFHVPFLPSKTPQWHPQQQCLRPTKATSPCFWCFLSHRKGLALLPPSAGEEPWYLIPPDAELCFTARRETSACPELYRPAVFEMETTEWEMATKV